MKYTGVKNFNADCADILDKGQGVSNYIRWMLNRTQSMFKYDGLPPTIPQVEFELLLQINGFVAVGKAPKNGIESLFCFGGGLGGPPDEYYRPTLFILANPVLGSKEYKISQDCVIVKSDSMYQGLFPMFQRYASLLVENEVSIYVAQINSRAQALISAPDDNTKRSAEIYLENIKMGKLGVIAENAFLDGIRSTPLATSSSSSALTGLIELEQYLKASWYNEIGLNANYNMKRESIMSSEAQLNTDALLPLIDDMLECRINGVNAINEMFGTDISVKLASSWEDVQIEENMTHDSGEVITDVNDDSGEVIADVNDDSSDISEEDNAAVFDDDYDAAGVVVAGGESEVA